MLHTSHNRILPRKTLFSISNLDRSRYKVREANGQEEITDRKTGGSYKILAPQRGARGEDGDTLVVDEVREFEDWDFIAAGEPIVASSDDPQIWYLSNAGTDKSVVLNDLRRRALEDVSPDLCYMEWSAPPELAADDHAGWMLANPSIGYGNLTLERLQALFDKYTEAGEQAIFETEHLCRWVVSMMPRLVQDTAWQQCRGPLETPNRPAMGISVDPSGKRASAALAWKQSDGSSVCWCQLKLPATQSTLLTSQLISQHRHRQPPCRWWHSIRGQISTWLDTSRTLRQSMDLSLPMPLSASYGLWKHRGSDGSRLTASQQTCPTWLGRAPVVMLGWQTEPILTEALLLH